MNLRRRLREAETKGRAMAHDTDQFSDRWLAADETDCWCAAIRRWAYDDERAKMRREHDIVHRMMPQPEPK